MVLDYIFIAIFEWGTAGAALATSLGFVCATVYYIVCMIHEGHKGNQLVPLTPRRFSPNAKMVRSVVSIGIPGALITVLMSVSNIVLNNYIGIYGSDAVAAYGVAYKLYLIPILLSVGLSQGVAPLVGYCYGRNERKRMTDMMKYSILYGTLLGAVFTFAFVLCGKQLAAIFLQNHLLIEQTGYFLKILCLSAPLLGIINMITSYFQALGKAIKSLIITVLRNAALFIPGVIILNHFWKLNGNCRTACCGNGFNADLHIYVPERYKPICGVPTTITQATASKPHRYIGFKFLLSLSTIQAILFSRPASVFASKYARV